MSIQTAFASAGLALLTLTGGAFAAGKLYYNPFRNMTNKQGHIFMASSYFSGEVKLYTPEGSYIGSYGADGPEDSPIVADVQVDDRIIHLASAGRHELWGASGELLGYADLNPESAAERARWMAAHNKALGHEISLPLSSGSDDGWGTALGFFGSDQEGGLLTWRFDGVGKTRFLFKHKVVRSGTAFQITSQDVEGLRQTLSPQEFREKVRLVPPSVPIFEWTTGGITRRHKGYASLPLTLPNGTQLTVQFTPDAPQFTPDAPPAK